MQIFLAWALYEFLMPRSLSIACQAASTRHSPFPEILSTLHPFFEMFFNMSHHGTWGGLNKVGIIAYLETTERVGTIVYCVIILLLIREILFT